MTCTEYSTPPICPYCSSADVRITSKYRRTVGYVGVDGNHHEDKCVCSACSAHFTRHFVLAKNAEWYSDSAHHVLHGEPQCCETGFMTKCACGGWKQHSTYGKVQRFTNRDGVMVPDQPMYFECGACHERTET